MKQNLRVAVTDVKMPFGRNHQKDQEQHHEGVKLVFSDIFGQDSHWNGSGESKSSIESVLSWKVPQTNQYM